MYEPGGGGEYVRAVKCFLIIMSVTSFRSSLLGNDTRMFRLLLAIRALDQDCPKEGLQHCMRLHAQSRSTGGGH